MVPNFLVKTEVVVSTSASQSIHKHDIANAISELHSSLDAAGSTLINDFTLGTVLVVTTTEPTINIGSPTLIVQTYPLAAPYSRLITWPAIPNALSYNVRCTDQYSVAILKSAPQTSITITDLVVGSTYRCAVAVLTSTGVGAYSTPSDAFTVTKREVQVTLTTIFQVSSTKSCTEADIASMVQQACAIATNYVVTTQSIPARELIKARRFFSDTEQCMEAYFLKPLHCSRWSAMLAHLLAYYNFLRNKGHRIP